MTLRRHQRAVLTTAAVSALLLGAACGSDGSTDTAGTDSSASAETTEDTGSGVDESTEFTAGTYTGEGSYSNPGGTSSVSVEMTLTADGTVEDVTVTPEASGTSLQYQEKFAGGIADEVVGKKLADLDVSKVAGSSLTSGGFNQAVEQIAAEAQA